MQKASQMKVENLDHLGLIAGLVDEIGIVERINQLVGEQPGEIVSPGLVVKAMIINGLGMVSAPLYLFYKFFEGKAIEHLLGSGIQASHLNDDRLGRVLDKLYLAGITEIFTTIALEAAQKFEINTDTSDLDSSSFHLHGKYEQELPSVSFYSTETDSNQLENLSINHSPERIEALTLIMGLCLLVYTLGQRLLRQNLQLTNKTVKNQLGKGTNRPTLRWIFQSFQSIHAVCIQGIQQVSNLTSDMAQLLAR
ncbi:DUF4277 domain-containing protein [Microcoleus sp. CAWBG640]|uniref:DUF4277 domain-containing protein n=1 Tax=Microcoleus sp. CAWBG640 TaxID=2841653 RepID=UPI00312B2FC0